jgi:hypothetical protein
MAVKRSAYRGTSALTPMRVYLKKTPEGFLVMLRDPWEIFFEDVKELSDDFMAGGRRQPR